MKANLNNKLALEDKVEIEEMDVKEKKLITRNTSGISAHTWNTLEKTKRSIMDLDIVRKNKGGLWLVLEHQQTGVVKQMIKLMR